MTSSSSSTAAVDSGHKIVEPAGAPVAGVFKAIPSLPSVSTDQDGEAPSSRRSSEHDASPDMTNGVDANGVAGTAAGLTPVYKNVIFDFDSTVITGESLEMMLADLLNADPKGKEKMTQIEEWTKKGMNGECSFKEGLTARLNIAAPRFADVQIFHERYCPSALSAGMKELVDDLQASGCTVYILSGGFTDVILPFGAYLNVPKERVFAVEIDWDPVTGAFVALNEANGFVESKLEGASRIKGKFEGTETLIVGDGYTDFKLYEQGITTDFVAYVEHAEREKVVNAAKANGRGCARSTAELRERVFKQ